jgi:hypothetical protein
MSDTIRRPGAPLEAARNPAIFTNVVVRGGEAGLPAIPQQLVSIVSQPGWDEAQNLQRRATGSDSLVTVPCNSARLRQRVEHEAHSGPRRARARAGRNAL